MRDASGKHIVDSGQKGQKRRDKERRREESEARIDVWREMSPEQQLQNLDDRGMAAKKQRVRIQEKIPAK